MKVYKKKPHLFFRPVSGFILLQLPLTVLQLHLRVSDVTAKTVRMEIVIAAGLSEHFPFLWFRKRRNKHNDIYKQATNHTKYMLQLKHQTLKPYRQMTQFPWGILLSVRISLALCENDINRR